MQKQSRKKSSRTTAVVFGFGISLLICIVVLSVCAVLILKGAVSEEGARGCVLASMFIASFAGSIVTGKNKKIKKVAACLMNAGLLCGVLILLRCFCENGPMINSSLFMDIVVLMAGGGLAAIIGAPKSRNRR